MKKIILGLIISITALTLAGAQSASSTATTTVTSTGTTTATTTATSSSTSTQTLVNALITRENAIIAAQDVYNLAIKNALTVRRDALASALQITDRNKREIARKAAWNKFRSDSKTAHKNLKDARKQAWKNFENTVKTNKLNDKTERYMERFENDSY